MTKMRTLTNTDKTLVAMEMFLSGIKARIRMLNGGGMRVCFSGSWEVVANVLNANGYRAAGGSTFTRFAFNDINGEVFVRLHVEA